MQDSNIGLSVKKIALKMSIFIIIMFSISIFGLSLYSNYAKITSNASYVDKLERLKSVPGQKAVFVGGSATHLGVRAELFTKETGIESVNMGLNAGTSFGLYIDSVAPYLKKGDILFLCPEYGYYSEKYYNENDNNIEFMYYYNPEVKKYVQKPFLIKSVPQTIMVGWKNLGFFFQDSLRDTIQQSRGNKGIYYRQSSNEYGDMIAQKDLPNVAYTSVARSYKDIGFINSLKKKSEQLEEKDVQVFFLFPPYNHTSFEISKQAIIKIKKDVEKSDLHVLIWPEEAAFKDNCFFDTVYHLNYKTSTRFTQMIIDKYENSTK